MLHSALASTLKSSKFDSNGAGNVPPKADLGQLQGLEAAAGGGSESAMIDGGAWDGAKAYKDSKVCNMLTMGEMHRYVHPFQAGIGLSNSQGPSHEMVHQWSDLTLPQGCKNGQGWACCRDFGTCK